MSGDWRLIGLAENALFALLPPRKFLVEHKRTRERRVVWAYDADQVGQAIAKGNWAD